MVRFWDRSAGTDVLRMSLSPLLLSPALSGCGFSSSLLCCVPFSARLRRRSPSYGGWSVSPFDFMFYSTFRIDLRPVFTFFPFRCSRPWPPPTDSLPRANRQTTLSFLLIVSYLLRLFFLPFPRELPPSVTRLDAGPVHWVPIFFSHFTPFTSCFFFLAAWSRPPVYCHWVAFFFSSRRFRSAGIGSTPSFCSRATRSLRPSFEPKLHCRSHSVGCSSPIPSVDSCAHGLAFPGGLRERHPLPCAELVRPTVNGPVPPSSRLDAGSFLGLPFRYPAFSWFQLPQTRGCFSIYQR